MVDIFAELIVRIQDNPVSSGAGDVFVILEMRDSAVEQHCAAIVQEPIFLVEKSCLFILGQSHGEVSILIFHDDIFFTYGILYQIYLLSRFTSE
jgi:hypothetical protein